MKCWIFVCLLATISAPSRDSLRPLLVTRPRTRALQPQPRLLMRRATQPTTEQRLAAAMHIFRAQGPQNPTLARPRPPHPLRPTAAEAAAAAAGRQWSAHRRRPWRIREVYSRRTAAPERRSRPPTSSSIRSPAAGPVLLSPPRAPTPYAPRSFGKWRQTRTQPSHLGLDSADSASPSPLRCARSTRSWPEIR